MQIDRVSTPVFLVLLSGLMFILWTATLAVGQADWKGSSADRSLRNQWTASCKYILEGKSWAEIIGRLDPYLEAAGGSEFAAKIGRYMESMRLAEAAEANLPENGPEATPEELVALFTNSRLRIKGNQGNWIFSRPLMYYSNYERPIWEWLSSQPEHDFTDPAIRAYKRGREMIPHLIGALEDMCATRIVWLETRGDKPPVLFRKCDLALAVLEGTSRCRFYAPKRFDDWFSHAEGDARAKTIELIHKWHEATSDLSAVESRAWLVNRVEFTEARQIINLMIFEGETSRGIELFRGLLGQADGTIRTDVAGRLATLGDPTGLHAVVQRVEERGTMERKEVDLLVAHGGPREYRALAEILSQEITKKARGKGELSWVILTTVGKRGGRLAIPVLAVGLEASEQAAQTPLKGGRADSTSSRSEYAAAKIQKITELDFKYSATGSGASRQRALDRVRAWWREEGRVLFGFDAGTIQRGGGLR